MIGRETVKSLVAITIGFFSKICYKVLSSEDDIMDMNLINITLSNASWAVASLAAGHPIHPVPGSNPKVKRQKVFLVSI